MIFFKKIPFQLILFIFFLGCLILFINNKNTVAFGLQSYGIKSIVEYGSFSIENALGTNPTYYTNNPSWDVFLHKNYVYFNKQPGIFLVGALIYLVLYKSGLSFDKDSTLVCGLLAIFTSVILLAIIMVLAFNIFFHITRRKSYSLLGSIFLGFGTILLPYSGILHHDIFAAACIFLGFYFLFCRLNIFLSGFFTGLSLFFSYNSIAMMLISTLYSFFQKNTKNTITYLIGFIFSLSFCFIFNFIFFDNPLKFAGNLFNDIVNHPLGNVKPDNLSFTNIGQKLIFYLFSPIASLIYFSPIAIVGLLGFIIFPKKYLLLKKVILISLIAQLIQLSTIEAVGWCQYGPRYLLETIPFMLLGLIGFFVKENKYILRKNKFIIPGIVFIGIVSILISIVGTNGVIFCGYNENAFIHYTKKMLSGDIPEYYFAPVGLLLILIAFILFSIKYKRVTKIPSHTSY